MQNERKIAIVDDHAMIRESLSLLVNRFPNCKVTMEAANGKEFIALLNEDNIPDILLLDINMPQMDGYATAKWIQNNYPEIRVLALSTMEEETSIIRMIKSGAKGYVLKGANPAELKLAFDELMTKGFFYNDIVSRKVIQSINQLANENSAINIIMNLNDKEIEFLKHACSEKSYRQIATEMFLSERTIDNYRDALFKKFEVSTRVGLTMFAIKNGIVKL